MRVHNPLDKILPYPVETKPQPEVGLQIPFLVPYPFLTRELRC